MGAINQAFNQAAGSVAAAAAIVKGAKEQDMSQALLGKEQYHEAAADLTKLRGESDAAGKAVEETSATYDAAMAKRPGGKGNTKAAIAERQKKALTEKDAAQRAFDELQDRIEAKQAMKKRAELMMSKANKWGGIR